MTCCNVDNLNMEDYPLNAYLNLLCKYFMKKINYKQLQDYQAVFKKMLLCVMKKLRKKYNEKHSKYSK